MLLLVSPAKSLDFESAPPTKKYSIARMLEQSSELVDVMRTYSPEDLSALMHISPDLAELNFDRFQNWEAPTEAVVAQQGRDHTRYKQALLAFTGDVYQGMNAAQQFDARDYTQAQRILRILSGLYGVLRPLDLMAPYRLEMGSRVATSQGADLYDFWGDTITRQLNADLAESPGPDLIVNLASMEYFNSVHGDQLDGRLVAPVFLDHAKNDPHGEPKIISFHAKRARGLMAGWIIRERIRSLKALTDFAEDGYAHDAERSTPDRPVFVR